MKCQSCDIHEVCYVMYLPEVFLLWRKGDIIDLVRKELCSECTYELAEKIKDMF